VLIELPLAGFFLKKMRNPHSDVNDLVTLDPELYRNLMFMRDYDGDFADLALTFTTADADMGHNREVRANHYISHKGAHASRYNATCTDVLHVFFLKITAANLAGGVAC